MTLHDLISALKLFDNVFTDTVYGVLSMQTVQITVEMQDCLATVTFSWTAVFNQFASTNFS